MPHTRSAKKNLRKIAKRRLHNRTVKKGVKTELKGFQTALDGSVEEVRTQFKLACKKLDKAAAKRVIHANQAARKKSQLARALNAKEAAPKPAAT
jgi:small subunit ribosomal protein S20